MREGGSDSHARVSRIANTRRITHRNGSNLRWWQTSTCVSSNFWLHRCFCTASHTFVETPSFSMPFHSSSRRQSLIHPMAVSRNAQVDLARARLVRQFFEGAVEINGRPERAFGDWVVSKIEVKGGLVEVRLVYEDDNTNALIGATVNLEGTRAFAVDDQTSQIYEICEELEYSLIPQMQAAGHSPWPDPPVARLSKRKGNPNTRAYRYETSAKTNHRRTEK